MDKARFSIAVFGKGNEVASRKQAILESSAAYVVSCLRAEGRNYLAGRIQEFVLSKSYTKGPTFRAWLTIMRDELGMELDKGA